MKRAKRLNPTGTKLPIKIEQEDKTITSKQIALHNRITTPYNSHTFIQPRGKPTKTHKSCFSNELIIIYYECNE